MATRRRSVVVVLGLVAILAVVIVTVFAVGASRSQSGNDGTTSVGAIGEAPQAAENTPGADAEARSAAGSAAAPAAPTKDQAQQPQPLSVVPETRSVVRTAALSVEVNDVERAAADVRQATSGAGGYVADERSRTEDAKLTVKVPTDRLDQALDRIAGIGKVTTRSQQADDVTEKVADLEGRLATARASVARVRGLLERASSVGEIVEIEAELTRREADLESLQRRLKAVNAQVALSTVTVDLRREGAPPPAAQDEGFLAGLSGGWQALAATARWAGAVLGAVLPFVPVLLAIGWGAVLLRRVVRRRQATAG